MILVLDNYDSFTYNLVQYFGELGAELVVRRNDRTTIDEVSNCGPKRSAYLRVPGRLTRPESVTISFAILGPGFLS